MRALVVIASSLAALIVGAVALADTAEVDDNRNAGANLFDIEVATGGHRGALLEHTVRTYHGWRSSVLRSTSEQPRMIAIYIWKPGRSFNSQHDYEVFARFEKGKLRGSVVRVRPREKKVGTFRVRRLDRRSIAYAFDKRLIGDPSSYQWQAVTGFTGKGCPKVKNFQFGCDDSAPTGATQAHDLSKP